MAEIKDYIWAFPLIGGIISIIGLFSPSAYWIEMGFFENYYMCGLWRANPYGMINEFIFQQEPHNLTLPIFIVGFISFLIILICTFTISVSAIVFKKRNKDIEDLKNTWVIFGILFIIAAIFYIMGVEITTNVLIEETHQGTKVSFWEVYNPGFGVIAPFISGALSIVGVAVGKSCKSISLLKSDISLLKSEMLDKEKEEREKRKKALN